MQTLSQAQLQEIEGQIRAGRKIEAIKLFREYTGTDLKEAKDAVERIEAEGSAWLATGGGNAPADGRLSAADRQRVVAALKEGKKIEAIKLYREATGVDLKEAKEAVEAMPGGQQAGGGCMGVILLFVAIVATACFVLPRTLRAARVSPDAPPHSVVR